MKRKQLFCLSFILLFLTVLAPAAGAQMSSANYSIPASVFSGGGTPMGSANYEVTSTLAQPSPLRETADPPESANYVFYPGFWYTIEDDKVKVKYMPWIPLLLLED